VGWLRFWVIFQHGGFVSVRLSHRWFKALRVCVGPFGFCYVASSLVCFVGMGEICDVGRLG